jgi:hypothetical protein
MISFGDWEGWNSALVPLWEEYPCPVVVTFGIAWDSRSLATRVAWGREEFRGSRAGVSSVPMMSKLASELQVQIECSRR